MAICLYVCNRMKLPSFFGILLSAVVISLFAGGLLKFLPIIGNLDSIIVAAIMPLVPGVAITNAVFDTLHGDYISGTARMMEAFRHRCFRGHGHRHRTSYSELKLSE